VGEFWNQYSSRGDLLVNHLYMSLVRKFISNVEVLDVVGYNSVKGRPCLYLANHQVALESPLFVYVCSAIGGRLIFTVAKVEHQHTWIHNLAEMNDRIEPAFHPVEYFDRDQPDGFSLLLQRSINAMSTNARSLLIHVEGTRRRSALRDRVQNVSPIWAEVAIQQQFPIVPVRFLGGLPVEDPGDRQEFPIGFGSQTIRLGRPVLPEELAAMPADQRASAIRNAINDLLSPSEQVPHAPDPAFAKDVAAWCDYAGTDTIWALVFQGLVRYYADGHFPTGTGEHVVNDYLKAVVTAGQLGITHRKDVALVLPSSPDGDWTARLCSLLFGSTGPRVYREGHVPAAIPIIVFVQQ
jgi:1-acyl-sn-glycerol-3-phosphate acyltransferase